MIITRFNTVIVLKSTVKAKWAGGIDGFKRDMLDCQAEGSQEDEFLITAGYSMGSTKFITDALTAGGLTVTETRSVVVGYHPTILSAVLGFFIGQQKATKLFGLTEYRDEVYALDAACAGMGAADRCSWLESSPEHPRYAVQFKQPDTEQPGTVKAPAVSA